MQGLQTQELFTYFSVFAEGVVCMNSHLGYTPAFDLSGFKPIILFCLNGVKWNCKGN